MRNDLLDELESIPSLRADAADIDEHEPAGRAAHAQAARQHKKAAASSWAVGGLAALVCALLIALAALGWWSYQQLSLMEQQLVATQESFARISEDAAGRLQDISGKVVATESSVTGENEALKLRLKQAEAKLQDLARQQQAAAGQLVTQAKRLDQFGSDQGTLQGTVTNLGTQLDTLKTAQATLQSEQASLKTAQQALNGVTAQLQTLTADVAALKKQGNPNPAIERIGQDLLVLRSQIEARTNQVGSSDFDAFRAQVTRNITSLQSQIQSLQQQISAQQ
jgi:chromosome segregation ATPase